MPLVRGNLANGKLASEIKKSLQSFGKQLINGEVKRITSEVNHHLCVQLSANYLLVDRANLYQTGIHLQLQEMGFPEETQLKEMCFPREIQLKEKKSRRGQQLHHIDQQS